MLRSPARAAPLLALLLLCPPALASDFVLPVGESMTVDVPLGFQLSCPHVKVVTGFDKGIISVDPMSPSKKTSVQITGLSPGTTSFDVSFMGDPDKCPGSAVVSDLSVTVTPDGDAIAKQAKGIYKDELKAFKSNAKDVLIGTKDGFKDLLGQRKDELIATDEFLDQGIDLIFGTRTDLDDFIIGCADSAAQRISEIPELQSAGGLDAFGPGLVPTELRAGDDSLFADFHDDLLALGGKANGMLMSLSHKSLGKGVDPDEIAFDIQDVADPGSRTVALDWPPGWTEPQPTTPVAPATQVIVSYARPCQPGTQGARALFTPGSRTEFDTVFHNGGFSSTIQIQNIQPSDTTVSITYGSGLGDTPSDGGTGFSGPVAVDFAEFGGGDLIRGSDAFASIP